MKHLIGRSLNLILLMSFFITACVVEQPYNAPLSTGERPKPSPSQMHPTDDVPSISTSTPPEKQGTTLWLSRSLPANFLASLNPPSDFIISNEKNSADFILTPGIENPVSHWVYVLAAPFPTLTDNLAGSELMAWWRGEIEGVTNEQFTSLLMEKNAFDVFSALWGPPGKHVKITPSDQLLDTAWETQTALAILPFAELQPKWKVLSIDNISPMLKDFDLNTYPLTVPISLIENNSHASNSLMDPLSWIPVGNRDPDKLTTFALTGVTALVRATASYMEIFGITSPAESIAPLLKEADILHISNEIPFAEGCPFPDPASASLIFCSRDKYIELLEFVGADVIELTGDHFQDWGDEAMLHTLDLYDQRGWPTYGGGENLEDARQPLLLEHNNNRIAILGCNGKELGYARASETNPGAYHCDMTWMESEVNKLAAEGYHVIVTFQHLEYYESWISPKLQDDFRRVAEAGAIIVSGSQAHQPHGFEFYENALIHYGLGNLFFDQYSTCTACRSAFIDQHVFYDGRYLGVVLITTQFENNAKSRLTTQEERENLLNLIFSASEW